MSYLHHKASLLPSGCAGMFTHKNFSEGGGKGGILPSLLNHFALLILCFSDNLHLFNSCSQQSVEVPLYIFTNLDLPLLIYCLEQSLLHDYTIHCSMASYHPPPSIMIHLLVVLTTLVEQL